MEGEPTGASEAQRRERERQEAEARAAAALGQVGLSETTAAGESSDVDPDAARRDFPWFGEDRQAVERLVAEGIEPGVASADLEAARARLEQVTNEAYGDPDDEALSPWSTERAVLDRQATARLIAEGVDRETARERVEYATDKERFKRAVARGINEEDAASAVEGARLVQQRAEAMAAQAEQPERLQQRPSGDIAADTDGELTPRYDFVLRRADRLAIGDLLREERFGEVRVGWIADAAAYDELRHTSLVQVFWTGDDGSRAARMYPVDARLTVRVPDLQDASAIERAIERSRYHGTGLEHREARRIAAHLQHGPGSALYRLAVTGELPDTVTSELDDLAREGRPAQRRWARALRAYCDRREDRGPLPGLEERQW